MRRPLLALALLIVALLACCGVVLGFLAWQNQLTLSKQVDDLKLQLNSNSPPAATPTPSGTTTPPTTPPATACVGEGKTIGVDAPTSKCCPGLVQLNLTDSTSVSQGLMFKCVRL